MDSDEWLVAIAAAGTAPVLPGALPPRFVMLPDCVELHVDGDLPRHGPVGRATRLSCGAALMNLRVALCANGITSSVHLRTATDQETSLVAVIRTAGRHAPTPGELALHSALAGLRHRGPVDRTGAPRAIVYAAGAEGGYLRLVRDLPTTGPVPELLRSAGWGGGHPWRDSVLGLLMSPGDTPFDQFGAGQALQRARLTAIGHGLHAHLECAVGDAPATTGALRALAGSAMRPQAVVWFGTTPAWAATARHRVAVGNPTD
jgi:hypothetical protein